jgi:hypothetical protein
VGSKGPHEIYDHLISISGGKMILLFFIFLIVKSYKVKCIILATSDCTIYLC